MDKPTPGLLDLHLTINKGNLSNYQNRQARRKLNRRLPLLEREMVGRSIRHAVRNYVGLLYFRTGEKDQAILCWEHTVHDDPTNLNAMQDLSIAYDKLGDYKKSGEWQKRLEDVKTRLSGREDEERSVNARCLAEQAYASCWDIHTNSWTGVDMMSRKVELYISALEYAENTISKEEKEEWCLGIGQAFERLAHMHFRSGDDNHVKYLECMDEAVRYLDMSLTSNNIFCRVKSWGVMGNVLTRDLKFIPKFIPQFVKSKYKAQWHKPALCYEEALSLDKGNSWILGCYGHLQYRLGWYCEALRLQNESIQNDGDATWFSRAIRAKVYTRLSKETRDQDFRKEFLAKAKEDAAIAGEKNPNPRLFSSMGEINHGLSICAESQEEIDHWSLKALGQFSESFEVQSGKSISDAYFKLAKCLVKRDRWSAIQSLKMAYSTSCSENYRHNVAQNFLLPNMLREYRSQEHPENLQAELATWIMDEISRSSSVLTIVISLATKQKFQKEVLDVIEYIVDNMFHLEGTQSVIEDAFEELNKINHWYTNYERLCSLESWYEEKKASAPSSSQSSITPLPDHIPPEQARNLRFKYDFYVITAEESTPWVQYSLLPGMECDYFSFKGYYHQRDTALGKMRVHSQAQPIQDSAYILIVLTCSFIENEVCWHLLEMARGIKFPEQIAVLLRDDTPINDSISNLKTFDFCGLSSSGASFQWFDLAKFMLRKPPE